MSLDRDIEQENLHPGFRSQPLDSIFLETGFDHSVVSGRISLSETAFRELHEQMARQLLAGYKALKYRRIAK